MPVLRWRKASGIVLLYAHDKVASDAKPWRARATWNRTGPSVCDCDFGGMAVKLQLPATGPHAVPYLYRNAAEQLFASRTPVAFFGNAYSTFSKGVALHRRAAALALARRSAAAGHTAAPALPKQATTPPPLGAAAAATLPQPAPSAFAYDCALAEEAQWKPRHSRHTGRIIRLHPGFHLLRPLDEDPAYGPGAGLRRHCGQSGYELTTPRERTCMAEARIRGDC